MDSFIPNLIKLERYYEMKKSKNFLSKLLFVLMYNANNQFMRLKCQDF